MRIVRHTSTRQKGILAYWNRGIVVIYHHVSKQHLHRYLAEFGFRYNARNATDNERTVLAVRAVDGKGLHTAD